MKLPILIVGVLMSTNVLVAQTDYKNASTTEGSNYEEVVEQQRQKFEKQNRERLNLTSKKQRKQFERWAYFWKDRVNADGTFPHVLEGWYNAGIIDENGQLIKQEARLANTEQKWVNVGPQKLPEKNGYANYPQMGRLNSFLAYEHDTDENQNVYFVGAPAGGVWKSTDGGNTWSPKLDQLAGIGVTDIRSSSNDMTAPGVLYVSTGDYDGTHINSIGIYKSTDFGETYTPTKLTFALNQKEITSNLVVFDDNTVIVGTKNAVKRTTDGGNTWTDVNTVNFGDPTFGRFVRHGDNVACADVFGGVYLSVDKGVNWTPIIPVGNNFNKIAIAVDNGTGVFYVQDMAGNLTSYDPKTTTKTALGKVPNYNAQGGFNQTLVVKEGLIISGSVNALTSSDNGKTWYNSLNGYWENSNSDGNYVHSDHHLMGDWGSPGYDFYSCNDGGLSFIQYQSKTDQKPIIEYMSSGVLVTQIYTVAITPQNPDYFMIGNQDNDGFSKEMHNGKVTWVAASAGDGTATAIDYSNSNIRYLGSQSGGLVRADQGFSGNYQGTQLTTPKGAGFVWPLKLHSTIPTTLYGGFGDVYESTDKGDNWTNLNSGLGAISVIETFGDNILAIGENGVKGTIDGGDNWTALVQPHNSVVMNAVTFNQKNPAIIYATIPSYMDGEKVYKSTDGGQTWTNISQGLPNIIMKTITLYQNQGDEILFAGTELGVYSKTNQDDWVRLGGVEMPNVIINDIDINYTTNTLVAATYGRGLWQLSLQDPVLGSEKLENNNNPIVKTNPITNGQVTVILSQNGIYQYDLYNVVGGIVLQGTLNNQNTIIDVSTIINGIYVLRTVDESGNVHTQKVIIKN